MKVESMFRSDVADSHEALEVDATAEQLRSALELEPCCSHFREMNRPTVSSSAIQSILLPAATALGFTSEHRGLFADGISGLRPDYYKPLGATGILLEVERGKTTTNNMDLLDFWKCHICPKANYLFLFVPMALQHKVDGKVKREFDSVRRRLAQFFLPHNRTNVRGLHLFGY